jgi:hypothetical protein
MTRRDREAIAAANPKADLAKAEEALALRGRLREALTPLRAAKEALAAIRCARRPKGPQAPGS